MNGENEAAASDPKPAEKQTRERSTIGFPYMDLKAAVELAEAIHANVGNGECDDDQLAAWSDQSAKSSTFRVQVYAARTFGILAGEASTHRLTDLGRAVVDPKRAREAKANAFLTVPLYKRIYDAYKGGVIPPAAALERDIVNFGVAPKQKDKARQVFERAADQAGFFEHGKNRLVAPGVQTGAEPPAADPKPNGGGGGGGGEEPPMHPLIRGLVDSLPKAGDVWSLQDAADWLEAAAVNLRIVYKFKGSITVTPKEPSQAPSANT